MAQDQAGPFVVTADDGTLFHCLVEWVPSEASSGEQCLAERWVCRSNLAVMVGPGVDAAVTADEVRERVNAWWVMRSTDGSRGGGRS
jgi:hypothetical protein